MWAKNLVRIFEKTSYKNKHPSWKILKKIKQNVKLENFVNFFEEI